MVMVVTSNLPWPDPQQTRPPLGHVARPSIFLQSPCMLRHEHLAFLDRVPERVGAVRRGPQGTAETPVPSRSRPLRQGRCVREPASPPTGQEVGWCCTPRITCGRGRGDQLDWPPIPYPESCGLGDSLASAATFFGEASAGVLTRLPVRVSPASEPSRALTVRGGGRPGCVRLLRKGARRHAGVRPIDITHRGPLGLGNAFTMIPVGQRRTSEALRTPAVDAHRRLVRIVLGSLGRVSWCGAAGGQKCKRNRRQSQCEVHAIACGWHLEDGTVIDLCVDASAARVASDGSLRTTIDRLADEVNEGTDHDFRCSQSCQAPKAKCHGSNIVEAVQLAAAGRRDSTGLPRFFCAARARAPRPRAPPRCPGPIEH